MITIVDEKDWSPSTPAGWWEVLCLDERRKTTTRWKPATQENEDITIIYPPWYVISCHRLEETARKHVAKCMKYPKTNKGLRFLCRRKGGKP